MQEFFKFQDMDIELSLLLDLNNNLIYRQYKNGKYSYELTTSQRELINEVLISLLPSNNIKNLGTIKYNAKQINHLYDLNNNFHIFYEQDNKITSDCLKLNAIFNNQEIYVSSTNKRHYNLKQTKRNVKIGKRILSVTISASILLSTILYIKASQKIIALIDNYRYQKKVEAYQGRQIQFIEIIDAINNNPNLTSEEKAFFLSRPEFFQDNLEFFDYYTVLDNLSRLRIEYIPTSSSEPGTYGEFIFEGNDRGLIKIYNSTCFEDAPKYALSHEFLHAFQVSYDNNYLSEGFNVLFNNEYFGNLEDNPVYDNAYSSLRDEIYILCELIDTDTLRQYYASGDINYLIKALMEIIPDEDMAIKLLTDIDFVCKSILLQNTDFEEYQKLSEEINIKKQEIKQRLQQYYETKYQISVTDDLYAFYFFTGKIAYTRIASELNFEFNAFLYADEFSSVKQYKKIFNQNGNDNLILSLCNEVQAIPKNYTLEEVLNGDTGLAYKDQSSIDLPLNADGTYLGVTYIPLNYIDYEVLSYSQKMEIENNNMNIN